MKKSVTVAGFVALCLALVACSGGPKPYRESCAGELDVAWRELDLAKADGFAGTWSYSKAFTLLGRAKTKQSFENFDGCVADVKKARFYISESRQGR